MDVSFANIVSSCDAVDVFPEITGFLFFFSCKKTQQGVFGALDDIKLKQKILALQRPVRCPQLGGFLMLRVGLLLLPAHRAMLQNEEMAKICKDMFSFFLFFILAKRKIYPPALQSYKKLI